MSSTTIAVCNPTSVFFLLDRSHSMHACKAATIEGFNGYITGLREENDASIDLTFLQFDTIAIDKVYVAVPIHQVELLNEATYQPRGGTPLIDAAVKTINAVSAVVAIKTGPSPKVVINFQTDGEENASRDHTWEELHGLIAEKTALGWQFNFLGAGINAYAQGSRMGIAAASTMSYNSSDAGATKSAFRASAVRASNFAAGRATNTDYTAQDRQAAGDAYWSKSMPIDLAETVKPKPQPASVVKPTDFYNTDLTL